MRRLGAFEPAVSIGRVAAPRLDLSIPETIARRGLESVVLPRPHPLAVMHWHLVHVKPRQERHALHNLKRLGYECYLPTLPPEQLQDGDSPREPLFPGYLFVYPGERDSPACLATIHSTEGVSRVVRSGIEPVKVDGQLVELLRSIGAAFRGDPHLGPSWQWARLGGCQLARLRSIFRMVDGNRRNIVLIEVLSRSISTGDLALSKAG